MSLIREGQIKSKLGSGRSNSTMGSRCESRVLSPAVIAVSVCASYKLTCMNLYLAVPSCGFLRIEE